MDGNATGRVTWVVPLKSIKLRGLFNVDLIYHCVCRVDSIKDEFSWNNCSKEFALDWFKWGIHWQTFSLEHHHCFNFVAFFISFAAKQGECVLVCSFVKFWSRMCDPEEEATWIYHQMVCKEGNRILIIGVVSQYNSGCSVFIPNFTPNRDLHVNSVKSLQPHLMLVIKVCCHPWELDLPIAVVAQKQSMFAVLLMVPNTSFISLFVVASREGTIDLW